MQKIKSHSDERGKLVPITFSELPFKPKRTFYVGNVPTNTIRGGHAHFKNRQMLICVSGKILVGLDYGDRYEEKMLCEDEACIVENMVWDTQKFMVDNSLLLVLCSEEFDKDDYIKDIERFYELVKENNR